MHSRRIFILAFVLGFVVVAVKKGQGADRPVEMKPMVVSEAPFGYIGVKHATVSLSIFRLLTFRGSIRFLQIDALAPDSPGVRAGIRPGDRILALNGMPLTEWSLGRLKRYGEQVVVGQKIVLSVARPPDYIPMPVTVVITKKPR